MQLFGHFGVAKGLDTFSSITGGQTAITTSDLKPSNQ